MTTSPSIPTVDQRLMRKVIVAAGIGNFVEWFDFAVYGFLAITLATLFFPSTDPVAGLLATFAVFAVAFALRPIGGLVFGALGDRVGRRRILSLTILLMAGATTAIGLLPTYATAGVTATVGLCLARSVQGFAAGGEYAGACAYVLEHCPPDRRGRYASFLPVSTFAAFGSAAVVAYSVTSFTSAAQMADWGWRVPFLVAAPLGLFGFVIRWRLTETPLFRALEADGAVAGAPLRETFATHWSTMLRLGGFISATALSFYTFTTYMSTYLQTVVGVGESTALASSVATLLLAAAMAPVMGRLSDRVGRKKSMYLACGALAVLVLPAFWLAGGGSPAGMVGGQAMLAVGAVMANVVTAVLLTELFPTRVRYTASAATYNLAYTVFGGTAPLVATWLIDVTGNPYAPAIYLLVVALAAWGCAALLPETANRPLDEEAPVLSEHPAISRSY